MAIRFEQFKRSVSSHTVAVVENQASDFTLQDISSRLPIRMRIFGGDIIRQTLHEMIAFGEVHVTQTVHPISLPNESFIGNLQPPISFYSKAITRHAA